MTLPANLFGPTQGPQRGGRAQNAPGGDPYRLAGKLHGPSVCPQCGAVYCEGRWRWGEAPAGAAEALCQACRRINDAFPAGVIALTGSFVTSHRDELLRAVLNQEATETAEHPFNRIMRISDEADGIVVTTTDLHLPRRIGAALTRAFHGKLAFNYGEDGYFLRVDWRRD